MYTPDPAVELPTVLKVPVAWHYTNGFTVQVIILALYIFGLVNSEVLPGTTQMDSPFRSSFQYGLAVNSVHIWFGELWNCCTNGFTIQVMVEMCTDVVSNYR